MLIKHEVVYQLINEFRKEHNNTVSNIVKLQTGVVYRRKPKYVELDERLNVIIRGEGVCTPS